MTEILLPTNFSKDLSSFPFLPTLNVFNFKCDVMGHITNKNNGVRTIITASRTTRERIESLLKKSKKYMTVKEIVEKTGSTKRNAQKILKDLILEGNVQVKPTNPLRYYWITEYSKRGISEEERKNIEGAIREYLGNLKEWDENYLNVVLSSGWKDIARLAGLNPEDKESFDKISEILKSMKK